MSLRNANYSTPPQKRGTNGHERGVFIMSEDGSPPNLDYVRERIRRLMRYERIPLQDGRLGLRVRLITAQDAHREFLAEKYGKTGTSK